jgi:DNA-binding beta-propeller fold protein YncE/cytochrome c peroxidase
MPFADVPPPAAASCPSLIRCRSAALRWLVLAASLFTATAPALAQQAPTPGVPNVPRVAGQLLVGPIMPQQGRLTILNYHNGILYSSPESPESGNVTINGVLKTPTSDYGQFTGYAWDLNQILAQPQVLPTPLAAFPGMFNGYNAHGSMHWNNHLGSHALVSPRYFRAGAFGTNTSVSSPMTPGHFQGIRAQMFPPFGFDMWWVSYGTMGTHVSFRRNGSILVTWNHASIAGSKDHPILFGNLLIYLSTAGNAGIIIYDMRNQLDGNPATNSIPPPVVGRLDSQFGGYWPEITGWRGRLYAVNGNRDVRVADLTNPTHPIMVGINSFGGSNAVYPTFQDNFAFVGGRKVDLSQPHLPVVLTLNQNQPHTIPGINANAGTLGFGFEVSQFNLPLGNLLVTGGIHNHSSASRQGMAIWAHQSAPDTKGPEIGFHIPRAGETNYPIAAPLSFAIPETLDMTSLVTGGMTTNVAEMTLVVRPVGGTPVAATIARSSGSIVTFTPTANLAPNTTYEVVFPAGGIKDAVGNGIEETYSYTFTTGGTAAGNQPPAIVSLNVSPTPVLPGGSATITASAVDPNPGDIVQYRVDFGDGSGFGPWSATNQWQRTYPALGHYQVSVQARDQHGAVSTRNSLVTVGPVPPGPFPTASSQLARHPGTGRIYVVNPDHDSVTVISPTLEREATITLPTTAGAPVDPRSVAVAADGRVWVTGFKSDRLYRLDPANQHSVQTIVLPYGSAPFGIAMSPDGTSAYVTYHGSGRLAKFTTADPGAPPVLRDLGPNPRALAVHGNGQRVFVTRFISHDLNYGTVWEVHGGTMALTRTFRLEMETNKWAADDAMGSPNYLASITLSPDNAVAVVTAKKDVLTAGPLFGPDGSHDLLPDRTVRTTLRFLDLSANVELANRRLDLDNSDSPSAAAFTPLGNFLLVAQQGNNLVTLLDHYRIAAGTAVNLQSMVGRPGTGLAPQALLVDPAAQRLYVHDFMSRTVTVLHLAPLLQQGAGGLPTLATIPTLPPGGEKLSPAVLLGKQLFYNASAVDAGGQNAMSGETYISCASCHIDGSYDGRTWDFGTRGEGLRNTTDLRGRRGMAHGNVHWSANFDEIQDFALDIVHRFHGTAFLPAGQAPPPPRGPPNAGRTAELDALAAYVASLGRHTVPRSPHRTPTGELTAEALLGQAVFTAQSCHTCHDPAHDYTNSSLGALPTLADVGTQRWTSGERLGALLAGLDVPTLAGAWATPPYLHDGSAATLADVFAVAGGPAYQAQHGVRSPTGNTLQVANQFAEKGNAAFGGQVDFHAAGASITFHEVDGGATGGTGQVELRIANASAQARAATLVVNGVEHPLSLPPLHAAHQWGTVRVAGVALTPGPTNTVVFRSDTAHTVSLDQIVVSRPEELARAHPHRRVLALPAAQRDQLLAFLRQLDGQNLSDSATPKPRSGPTLAADTFTVAAGSAPLLHVLANDTGIGLELSHLSAPALGTATIENNRVRYAAPADATTGTDSFTYAARDADGLAHWTTVTIEFSAAPPPTPFEHWIANLPVPPPAHLRGPLDDPDGDGLNNFLEFALGSDPMDPASAPRPILALVDGQLTLTYFRARADVLYTAQFSDDFVEWSSVGVHQGAGAVGTLVTASVPLPPGVERRFLRLHVAPAP